MTPNQFRKLALELPDAVEAEHMDHPDFRVGGKIFATIGPAAEWGMVKLTPEQQKTFVKTEPKSFEPFNGAWGKRGCTKVTFAEADESSVRQALLAAWRNTAPKKLLKLHDPE